MAPESAIWQRPLRLRNRAWPTSRRTCVRRDTWPLKPDRDDRRAKVVTLTAKGRRAAEAFLSLTAEIEAEFAAILGRAEMSRLRGLLEELGRRLDEVDDAESEPGENRAKLGLRSTVLLALPVTLQPHRRGTIMPNERGDDVPARFGFVTVKDPIAQPKHGDSLFFRTSVDQKTAIANRGDGRVPCSRGQIRAGKWRRIPGGDVCQSRSRRPSASPGPCHSVIIPWLDSSRIDGPTIGGISGGPVFDSRGYVAGVVSSSFKIGPDQAPAHGSPRKSGGPWGADCSSRGGGPRPRYAGRANPHHSRASAGCAPCE